MKRIIFLLLSVVIISPAVGQNGITFKVEDLSKPEKLLPVISSEKVYENLIMSDVDLTPFRIERDSIQLPFDIICNSRMPDNLVTFGYHSFFNGMYAAYADHRPFVLSPDMIWLLISQGFARHVNADPETLRHYFVDFSEKMTLVVVSDDVSLSSPANKWETIFPKFAKQLSQNTKGDIIDILSSDFSTTTPVEKIASQITIMESMKPYFDYAHMFTVCGIPEITLKGTPEDWQKILDKTRSLAQYDLEWWTNELVPLLEEFVKASNGDVDKDFWRNMFKYHTLKEYGAPKIIDGWIVKFFPYDNDGKRNNLVSLRGNNKLPDEIITVDLKHIDQYPNGKSVTTMLELWAGFIGLEQDNETYALTPKIGWMIRKKDVDNIGLQLNLEAKGKISGGIHIRVKEVPPALLDLKSINNLKIDFIDRIIIPDGMKYVKINNLILNGEISEEETKRIKEMFPGIVVVINGIHIR